MTLLYYDPIRRMQRLMEALFPEEFRATDVRQTGVVIPLNVYAEENAYVIDKQMLLQEIPVGHFKRVITLPTELEADEAEAELVNGVLTLRIPKAKALRPKEIKVKVRK